MSCHPDYDLQDSKEEFQDNINPLASSIEKNIEVIHADLNEVGKYDYLPFKGQGKAA